MKKVSGILSSKGQITLPKTVRDVLSLNTGDEIDFLIEENGEVMMKKSNGIISAAYNLVELLLESGIVVLTGRAGQGKTYFATNLIKKFFTNRTILIMDPHNEYGEIKSFMDRVYFLNSDIKYKVEDLLKLKLDIVLVEEPHSLTDYEKILALRESGTKVVIITQENKEQEMSIFETYYSVAIKRSSPANVKEIVKITNNGTIKKSTLYST